MDLERIDYKVSEGKTKRSSSIISRDDHDLDVSRSKKNEAHARKSLQARDSNKRDGKRRFKKGRDHQPDLEVNETGVVEMENSIADSNGGLVSLKFYQEMDEKYSLALKEKDLLIFSLRKDVQVAEDENTTYKTKLLALKEKFKTATDEIILAEKSHQKLSEKYKILQEQQEVLKSKEKFTNTQVTELKNRIEYLEDMLSYQENLPGKELEKCLKTMEAKEREIKELQNKLQNSGDHISCSDTSEILIYQKKLFEKNEKIKDLENKLKEAIEEIEESSKTFLMLKSERSQADRELTLNSLSQSEECLSKTEEKYLKKQLETLNHKLSLATEKIRRFEKNEFGLPEAIAEIEDLKKQLYMNDLRIGKLVSKINSFSANPEHFLSKRQEFRPDFDKPRRRKMKRRYLSLLQDKNLRNRTIYSGKKFPEYLSKEELTNKILKWGKSKKTFHQLSIKCQNQHNNRNITQGILEFDTGATTMNSSSDHQENDIARPISDEELPMDTDTQEKEKFKDGDGIKVRLEELIIENDCLRKGMHEILDSIRMQDGEYYASIKRIHLLALHFASSDVKLESKSLEHLLHALDQRHVSGWYHPAMRLEAELKSRDGVNASLREQIHYIRLEERKTKEELQTALSRLNSLESELAKCDSMNLPDFIQICSSEIVDFAKFFKKLLNGLHESHVSTFQTKLKENFQKLYDKFIVLHGNLKLFYQNHVDEKIKWDKEREELILNLEKTKASMKRSHLCAREDITMDNEVTNIESSEEVIKRKSDALESLINNLKREKEKLLLEVQELKTCVIKKEESYSRKNETANQQITILRRQLEESVPRSYLEETTKQLNGIIIKYRTNLEKDNLSIMNALTSNQIKEEVQSLNKEKEELQKELITARKKLNQFCIDENIFAKNAEDNETDKKVLVLSEKVARLEVGEITARQNLSHCEQMCTILKKQMIQLQEDKDQLQTMCSSLQKQNQSLQLVEMNLQDQCNNLMGSFGTPCISQKLQNAELHLSELQEENLKLKTMLKVAEEQIHSLLQLNLEDNENKSLRKQFLDVQSDNKDKEAIANISDELLYAHKLLTVSYEKNKLLEQQNENINSENIQMKQMLEEKDAENVNYKNVMTRYCRQFLRYILEMRIRYAGAVTLYRQEKISHKYFLLLDECAQAKLQARKMEDILNSSVDIKSQELISALKEQIKSFEDKINEQKEYITKLENENIEFEKQYELNKYNWEIREYELLKELGQNFSVESSTENRAFKKIIDDLPSKVIDVNVKENFQPVDSEKSIQVDMKKELEISSIARCSHAEEIVAQQNIIKELIEQLAKAEFELNEKEIELKELQGVMSFHTNCELEKKCNFSTPNDETCVHLTKEPRTREFGFVYKVTMDALNVMLNQKDEVLSRYKKIVTETREAHAKTLFDLNLKQNLHYPEKPSSCHEISARVLKNCRPQMEPSAPTSAPTEVPECANKFDEMQNEIILLQRKCDYLTVQLNIWESEAHQYKALADKRQVELEELLNRLESQQKSWFNGTCNVAKNQTGSEVVTELKELLIQTMEKEHISDEKLVITDTQFPNKTLVDIGTNTDILKMGQDVEIRDLKDIKKRSEKEHSFSLSRADAEVIDQELETISNLIEKAEEISDEKNSEKAMSECRLVQILRTKHASLRKSVRNASKINAEKLKDDMKVLEEQLHNCQLQLETVQKGAEMDIKRKVELARWGENKKWQHTVDKLQERLKAEKGSSDNLKKLNTSLKDAVVRLQREKTILESKAKTAVASKELESTWISGSEKRIEFLQKRISNLEKTICDLEALNISQKNKLDKYESKMLNLQKKRDENKTKNKSEDEENNTLSDEDILFEIKMLKEERENLLIENSKTLSKMNSLEKEIIELKDQNSVLEKKILVFLGKEETATMIHNEVNSLRVELARKAKLLHDVKGVLMRVREKTMIKKAAA